MKWPWNHFTLLIRYQRLTGLIKTYLGWAASWNSGRWKSPSKPSNALSTAERRHKFAAKHHGIYEIPPFGRVGSYFWITMVAHWSRCTSNFYALIGQNLTVEFIRKIYASSGNLLTDGWSWQSLVSSCDVFNCLFPLDASTKWNSAAFKILLLFISGLFIGFLVEKCAACESHWKPDFGWHRVHLAWCVRGLKSLKRFWTYLMAFRRCISTGKPE